MEEEQGGSMMAANVRQELQSTKRSTLDPSSTVQKTDWKVEVYLVREKERPIEVTNEAEKGPDAKCYG